MRPRSFFLALVAASGAQAQEGGTPYAFDLGFTGLGTMVRNQPAVTLPESGPFQLDLRPADPEAYPSMAMRAGIEAEVQKGVLLRGLFDTGEVRRGSSLDPPVDGATTSGLSLREAASEGFFVREAALDVIRSRWGVRAGRALTKVGGGLVYEDFGTGGGVDLVTGRIDGAPVRLSADGLLVGRTFSEIERGSTLWSLSLDVPLSWFEHVSPFVAFYVDRSGALRDVLLSAFAEAWVVDRGPVAAETLLALAIEDDPPSRGEILYLGADGMVVPADKLSLRASAVVAVGEVGLKLAEHETHTLRLRGFGAQIETHYGITERWDLGAFGVGLTGDRAPRLDLHEPTYAAFVAPAPYWAWTGLFFSGGLSQGFYPSRASAAGVNGHGVVGLGPIVSWQDSGPLLEARAAWLRAMADSPPPAAGGGGGGAVYGVEVDLRCDWDALRWLTVAGELDVLFPGSYFPEDKRAWRLIVLVDLHHEA